MLVPRTAPLAPTAALPNGRSLQPMHTFLHPTDSLVLAPTAAGPGGRERHNCRRTLRPASPLSCSCEPAPPAPCRSVQLAVVEPAHVAVQAKTSHVGATATAHQQAHAPLQQCCQTLDAPQEPQARRPSLSGFTIRSPISRAALPAASPPHSRPFARPHSRSSSDMSLSFFPLTITRAPSPETHC